MKPLNHPSFKFLFLVSASLLANSVMAKADPDATAPVPHVHHYAEAKKAVTYRVMVTGHNEFQNGKYVWIASHYADAPSANAYWIAPGAVESQDGIQAGHWSTETP